jgi:Protein of unknown function (DUF2735)
MTTNLSGSAKIYTFPARGRFAVGDHREESTLATNAQLPRGVRVASGSAWYHEAAIQAEQSRKN